MDVGGIFNKLEQNADKLGLVGGYLLWHNAESNAENIPFIDGLFKQIEEAIDHGDISKGLRLGIINTIHGFPYEKSGRDASVLMIVLGYLGKELGFSKGEDLIKGGWGLLGGTFLASIVGNMGSMSSGYGQSQSSSRKSVSSGGRNFYN